MPRRVLLHVGTHKTGTTSIQTFLKDENDGVLARAASHYPSGFLFPNVHMDLSLLALGPDRSWPARLRFPETSSAAWQAAAHAHIRDQVTSGVHDRLVYVHEDLSYVRSDDEIERLDGLFEGRAVTVVVVLRDRTDFMRSYRSQLEGTGFEVSSDRASFAYVDPDSWLLDYDALVGTYRRWVGPDQVVVLDYDALMRADGSVIPAIAELIGIERGSLPPLHRYQLNQSGSHVRLPDDERAAIRRRLARLYP